MRTKAAGAAFLVCSCWALGAVGPEAGAPLIRNYSPKTYGADAQNWAIAQDRRGVLYFGNNDGVLEFDGVTWRKIRVLEGMVVRSLAVDERGTVFVGAVRDNGD